MENNKEWLASMVVGGWNVEHHTRFRDGKRRNTNTPLILRLYPLTVGRDWGSFFFFF